MNICEIREIQFLMQITNGKQCELNSVSCFFTYRSCCPKMFCKKGVLRNFVKFTGKHLCQSLFFDKVAGLRLWHRWFPVNLTKFLRTPFFTEYLRWLLLHIKQKIGVSSATVIKQFVQVSSAHILNYKQKECAFMFIISRF